MLVLEAELERFIEAIGKGGVTAERTGGHVGERP